MGSAQIRMSEKLKNEMKEFLDDTRKFESQSDFANAAIREKLEREQIKQERMSSEDKEMIRKIIRQELEQHS